MLSEPPAPITPRSLYRSEAFAEDLFEPGEALSRSRKGQSLLRRSLFGVCGLAVLIAMAALLLYWLSV
ncbi:hypothetical protein WG899_15400 [Paucibacter sp. AS339]|uniref:hypothetical protein n=1 Tax=Paucibacter hankyongi TaxID=3133434 RepID=UPI0030A95224